MFCWMIYQIFLTVRVRFLFVLSDALVIYGVSYLCARSYNYCLLADEDEDEDDVPLPAELQPNDNEQEDDQQLNNDDQDDESD